MILFVLFFFKQKTAYEMRISDWSSDVCSSDLDDPVVFLEPKRLYNGPFDGYPDRPVTPWSAHPLGEVPEGHFTVPLGAAAVRRAGADVTVLAYGTMVDRKSTRLNSSH